MRAMDFTSDHVEIGTPVSDLPTPQVVVDLDRVDHNIRTMQAAVSENGVALRPHVKTHKTLEVARRQLDAGAVGITAAKPSEAAPYVAAGFDDVVIAYPAVGRRAAAIAELATSGARIIAHADSRLAVEDLEQAASAAGVRLEVRIEIDTGFDRCGVGPEAAVVLAERIEASPHLALDGITTHRSAFFVGAGGRDPAELGVEEGKLLCETADHLRSRGHEVRSVVGGSTPTAVAVSSVPGITEVCAGTYPFYDAGMASRGYCDHSDIAMSVLATVVSDRGDGKVTVDTGSKSLARDAYGSDGPFGITVDGRGRILVLSEEHGGLVYDADPPRLGSTVAIWPMHACVVSNLADSLVVARDGVVVDVWQVVARGKTR